MPEPVNPRRRYDASGRQENARHNRLNMLKAAHAMFLSNGYAGTSVPAVAAEAGVSVQSVYKAFGSKGGLLKAVFDVAMAGDDEDAPMVERSSLSAVRDEPDPRRKFALYGAFVGQTAPRHAPIQLIARDAGAVDPEAAVTWKTLCDERLFGMGMFARHLDEAGHLASGITADDARDLLWAYNSPETYDLLVNARGWSPERYGAWVASNLTHALLPPE